MSFLLKLLTDKFWLDQEVLYDYKTDLRVISPYIKVVSDTEAVEACIRFVDDDDDVEDGSQWTECCYTSDRVV